MIKGRYVTAYSYELSKVLIDTSLPDMTMNERHE